MENSIKGPDPLPVMKKKYFFSKTRPFFENFLKKVYFYPRNPPPPKKNLQKSLKNWKITVIKPNFSKILSSMHGDYRREL